jgi:putative transposase
MKVFFNNQDYALYVELLKESCTKAGTDIWAYCLMPNHVHLLLTPSHEDGLRAALGEAHRRYTRYINSREDWRGHLWQERFHSFVLDDLHLVDCARYVELNPVRAKLVPVPEDWIWSSARAHLKGSDDQLVATKKMLNVAPNWGEMLQQDVTSKMLNTLRQHSRTGRPLGGDDFVETVEKITGRSLKKRKPGPKGRQSKC